MCIRDRYQRRVRGIRKAAMPEQYKILVTLPSWDTVRVKIDETTTAQQLASIIASKGRLDPGCCFTLSGLPLEGDRPLAEYGVCEGMELETEVLKKRNASDLAGSGKAGRPGETRLDQLLNACKEGTVDAIAGLTERLPGEAPIIDQVCPFTSLTAVGAAAAAGHEEIVKLLIEQRASVSKVSKNMYPPLHAAASRGHQSIATLLLKAKADVDGVEDVMGFNAIHAAIDRGQEEMIALLVRQRANVNQVSSLGVSPLAHACAKGHIASVRFLLDNGAKMDTESKDGISPLGSACNKGQQDVAELLLAKGAVVDAQAFYAVLNTENEAMEALLAAHGSNASCTNIDRKTALHIAAAEGSTEIMAYLVDMKGDVNQADKNGYTPLMAAAKGGHKGSTRQLLQMGAEPKAQCKLGNTALHHVHADKPKVYNILIEVGGLDKDAVNNKGEKAKDPAAAEKCCIQ
eukprot:TRINITY_DN14289_c0_g2_i1.p1 TRINITY_DN14289_c0_g2~~TRINITY_DN14289_c0_g2_i1.p1  ORF type:complete len:460 (-),score=122.96 TRINITY_DN14289_c0_g2_i1:204-1583(-)